MSAPRMRDPKCNSLDDAVQELVWWLGDETMLSIFDKSTHDRQNLIDLTAACQRFIRLERESNDPR